jgi:lipopolysaccharide transport system ATP-binding protein
MNDTVISVRNVSKCYQVFENPQSQLIRALWPKHQANIQEVWALKEISFEIKRGEAVSIIGRNGGGKSTLLEIITGTLTPTTGEVKVNGRVSALLELGSGFNPEYTGRDNVILNGLLLGLSRKEILARFDEIIDFAEIGDALNRPVKTYSSGMVMRLAFAVQVLCEPDILIIDEALSVGDFFFQQKCLGHIRELCKKGMTLLFVSHDMGTVRDMCSSALYLRKGELKFIGDSKSAINIYLAEQTQASQPKPTTKISTDYSQTETVEMDFFKIKQNAFWSAPDEKEENRRLLAVRLLDAAGQPTTQVEIGEKIRIQVFFRTPPNEPGHIAFIIKNRFNQVITNNGTYLMRMDPCCSNSANFDVVEFDLDLLLEAGLYTLMFCFAEPSETIGQGNIIDDTGWTGPLHIKWDYEKKMAPFLGQFGLPCKGWWHKAPSKLLTADEILSKSILTGQDRSGEGGMEILAACVTDNKGLTTFNVEMMDYLEFYLYARALRTVKKPYFGIAIYDKMNNLVFTGTTVQKIGYSPELESRQEIVIGFKVGMTLQGGEYTFRLSCAEPLENHHPNKGVSLDAHGSLGPIRVLFDYEARRAPFYGIAQLPMEIL